MALSPPFAESSPPPPFWNSEGGTKHVGASRPSCCGHSRVLCVSMCPFPPIPPNPVSGTGFGTQLHAVRVSHPVP